MTVARGGAEVWEADLVQNALPSICAKTGEPTDNRKHLAFATANPLVFLTIPIGFVIFVLLYVLTTKRVVGYIPLSPKAERTFRLTRRAGVGGVLAGPILLVASVVIYNSQREATILATGSDSGTALTNSLAIVACVLLVGGVIGALAARLTLPGGKVAVHPEFGGAKSVVLTRVHPTFVAALDEMNADRAAAAKADDGLGK